MIAYDVIGLAAHLTSIVIDDDQNKKLVACRDEGAQALVNLLQAVCFHTAPPLDATDTRLRLPASGFLDP